jgi:hypothetical protein
MPTLRFQKEQDQLMVSAALSFSVGILLGTAPLLGLCLIAVSSALTCLGAHQMVRRFCAQRREIVLTLLQRLERRIRKDSQPNLE